MQTPRTCSVFGSLLANWPTLPGFLSECPYNLQVHPEALQRPDLSERQCASNEEKQATGEQEVHVVACGSDVVAVGEERSDLRTRAIGEQRSSCSRWRLLWRMAPFMASLGLVYFMHYLINQGLVCALTLTCTCSLVLITAITFSAPVTRSLVHVCTMYRYINLHYIVLVCTVLEFSADAQMELIQFELSWQSRSGQYRWFQVVFQIGAFVALTASGWLRIPCVWLFPLLQVPFHEINTFRSHCACFSSSYNVQV